MNEAAARCGLKRSRQVAWHDLLTGVSNQDSVTRADYPGIAGAFFDTAFDFRFVRNTARPPFTKNPACRHLRRGCAFSLLRQLPLVQLPPKEMQLPPEELELLELPPKDVQLLLEESERGAGGSGVGVKGVAVDSDLKLIAIVFPQFHACRENDEFWGVNFTEWDNVKRAFFHPTTFRPVAHPIGPATPPEPPHTALHSLSSPVPNALSISHPLSPLSSGYYNFLSRSHRRRTSALARAYGFHGLCYHHYWFGCRRTTLAEPLLRMLEDGEPNLPFCLIWANEPWTNRWDGARGGGGGGRSEVLLEQTYGDEECWKEHFDWLLKFFNHPNYIKVSGRPMHPATEPQLVLRRLAEAAVACEFCLDVRYYVDMDGELYEGLEGRVTREGGRIVKHFIEKGFLGGKQFRLRRRRKGGVQGEAEVKGQGGQGKVNGGQEGEADGEDGDDEEGDGEGASFPAAVTAADDHATTTILTLRACMEEKDAAIKKLQSQLDEAHADLQKWRSAFHPANILATETTAEPAAVVAAFETVREAEAQVQEKLLAARRREAAMLIRLAGREQEVVAVKEQLQQVLESMQPASTQTRSLLLDAAIHAEFKRLKTESEALERRVRELQDDLAAVQFTPHSKNGKMLMAKCRTLQEENEDIGREAAEGKVHELENKLALQKQLNSELKRGYQELQEYVDEINEEAEKLEETVYKLQRQLQLRDAEVQELSRFKAGVLEAERSQQHFPPPHSQQQQQQPGQGMQRGGSLKRERERERDRDRRQGQPQGQGMQGSQEGSEAEDRDGQGFVREGRERHGFRREFSRQLSGRQHRGHEEEDEERGSYGEEHHRRMHHHFGGRERQREGSIGGGGESGAYGGERSRDGRRREGKRSWRDRSMEREIEGEGRGRRAPSLSP
ncbi:unnamed protein product [Closterium sp. Naga37s-1]|nr:unnamed protein product [Closterium sp. Naga37s-1]